MTLTEGNKLEKKLFYSTFATVSAHPLHHIHGGLPITHTGVLGVGQVSSQFLPTVREPAALG